MTDETPRKRPGRGQPGWRGNGAGRGGPANGTVPPFEPGNMLTVKSGARSPRLIQPIADELATALLAMAGDDQRFAYLAAPMWSRSIEAWARAEARVQRIERYLADRGEAVEFDQEAKSPLIDQLQRWETLAANHRQRLGIDPLSHARLMQLVSSAGRDRAAAAAETLREIQQEYADGD